MKKTFIIGLLAGLMLVLSYSILAAEDDPFAGMDPGANSGVETPDGASSIRAKKKPSPKAFEGKIKAVAKSDKNFPMVTALKIEVSKVPTDKTGANGELEAKKIYFFALKYKKTADNKVDYADESTKENVGAFFFEKNDKIVAEIAEKKGNVYILEYVQRK